MVKARAKSSSWMCSTHGKVVYELFQQIQAKDNATVAEVVAAARGGGNVIQFVRDGSVEAQREDGLTPLGVLAQAGDASSVARLLASGAPVNRGGSRTPIELASGSGSGATVQALLENDADLSKCTELARMYSVKAEHNLLPGWAKEHPGVLIWVVFE